MTSLFNEFPKTWIDEFLTVFHKKQTTKNKKFGTQKSESGHTLKGDISRSTGHTKAILKIEEVHDLAEPTAEEAGNFIVKHVLEKYNSGEDMIQDVLEGTWVKGGDSRTNRKTFYFPFPNRLIEIRMEIELGNFGPDLLICAFYQNGAFNSSRGDYPGNIKHPLGVLQDLMTSKQLEESRKLALGKPANEVPEIIIEYAKKNMAVYKNLVWISVKQKQERERNLAVMLGTHPRLGEKSPFQEIDPDLLRALLKEVPVHVLDTEDVYKFFISYYNKKNPNAFKDFKLDLCTGMMCAACRKPVVG